MSVVRISDAEWEVMQVLWSLRRATAAEVIEHVKPGTGWSHRTVRTLLSRLVQKGALTAVEEGQRYLYRPSVTRKRCIRDASRSFLDKVFEGDPSELLVHFVRHSDISADEIEHLKQLLDQKLPDEE